MAGNNFVLDTNIISALFKGETKIADKIDKAVKIYIPIVVLGELYYGASYSTHKDKNVKDIQKLLSRYDILLIDETTIIYGAIKTALRKKGRPIPENDVWIAAIAKRNDLTLVTRDKHFKEIEDIAVKHW